MICAVVPAAGRSERMGVPKLLLPLAGTPIIARVVDALREAQLDEIRVVLGGEREALAQVLEAPRVRFVTTAKPYGDMLASIRSGLRGLPPDCEAVLVALGDQPMITPTLVRRVIHAFRGAAQTIVLPAHAGRRGHPVLLSIRHVPEVLESYDGVGLRGLIAAHPDEVIEVEVDDPAAFEDVDTPEDYARMTTRLREGP